MSTAAQVQAAWVTNVWQNASITALSAKIYAYDLEAIGEVSTAHKKLMYESQWINFWQYRVTKRRALMLSKNRIQYRFPVFIRYFREATTDTDGDIYTAVRDAFTTLLSVIKANLGTSWGGTVDFYEVQDEPVTITPTLVDDKLTWVGDFSFQGIQETDLS